MMMMMMMMWWLWWQCHYHLTHPLQLTIYSGENLCRQLSFSKACTRSTEIKNTTIVLWCQVIRNHIYCFTKTDIKEYIRGQSEYTKDLTQEWTNITVVFRVTTQKNLVRITKVLGKPDTSIFRTTFTSTVHHKQQNHSKNLHLHKNLKFEPNEQYLHGFLTCSLL